MLKLLKTPVRIAGTLFAAALLAAAQGSTIARPGTVNYTEGQVTLDGKALGAKSLGAAEVAAGQVLETDNGKAEMLLTPGVFVRLGAGSSLQVISPSLTDTRVQLLKGEALIEVAELQKENHLQIVDNGTNTQLEKKGLYKFDAAPPTVAVYDGKARVQQDDQTVDIGKGKELELQQNAKLKPQKFDRKQTDDLYAWSKLRSQYLAEANESSAQMILAANPWWYDGTGWYWNPWFDTWAFVPGAGLLYSPFGFGYFSPVYYGYYSPQFYRPYRYRPAPVIQGRGIPGRAVAPPAAGGSGVRFGPPVGRTPTGGFHAPAAGGGGVRFGGGRGR